LLSQALLLSWKRPLEQQQLVVVVVVARRVVVAESTVKIQTIDSLRKSAKNVRKSEKSIRKSQKMGRFDSIRFDFSLKNCDFSVCHHLYLGRKQIDRYVASQLVRFPLINELHKILYFHWGVSIYQISNLEKITALVLRHSCGEFTGDIPRLPYP
jgi:hypothetical protein